MKARCKKTWEMEDDPNYATFTLGKVYDFQKARLGPSDTPSYHALNDSKDHHGMDEEWFLEHFEPVEEGGNGEGVHSN